MASYQDGPQNFDRWLAYAIVGLSPDSQQRVRAELEAHYEDAFLAELATGRSEDEARNFILQTLGDPLEANRRFRKVYLCDEDLEKIKFFRNLYPFSKGWVCKLTGSLVAYSIPVVLFYLISNSWGTWLLQFTLMILVSDCLILTRQKILANFLFTSLRKGIERRFKATILTPYGLIGLGIAGFLGVILIHDEITKASGALRWIFVAVPVLLTLFICGLFIVRDLTNFISLQRKMRVQDGKNETPEWERNA